MRPETIPEIGDNLRDFGGRIESIGLNSHQLRTLSALRNCRTSALGGHVDACTECGTLRVSYNSCRNRHCPKCQGQKREEWIQARKTKPFDHRLCPCCGMLSMITEEIISPRGPPKPASVQLPAETGGDIVTV